MQDILLQYTGSYRVQILKIIEKTLCSKYRVLQGKFYPVKSWNCVNDFIKNTLLPKNIVELKNFHIFSKQKWRSPIIWSVHSNENHRVEQGLKIENLIFTGLNRVSKLKIRFLQGWTGFKNWKDNFYRVEQVILGKILNILLSCRIISNHAGYLHRAGSVK